MADIKFPKVLPIPVRDGYSREYDKKKKVIKMDDGSTREYAEFFGKPLVLNLTWKLATAKQLAIFDAFIKYELDYGSEFFDLVVEPGKAPIEVRLTEDAPRATPNGLGFDVSMSVMTIIPGILPPAVVSLALWPSALPLPLKESYTLQMQNIATQGTVGAGLATVRNRFQTKFTQFSVDWIFTANERDLFWEFYRTNLLDGSVPLRLSFYNGMGITQVRCKFLEHPKEVEKGACYAISGAMVTSDAPGLTEQEYAEELGGIWISDYAEDFFAEDYTEEVFIIP